MTTVDYHTALSYVGGCASAGQVQAHFVRLLGLEPEHKLLEIGAGLLLTAKEVAACCQYVGLEPNQELVDFARKFWQIDPEVYSSDDFYDPRQRRFEFILSHSVLTHTGTDQTQAFLKAVYDQLQSGPGIALVSVNLSTTTDQDSIWRYPDATRISRTDWDNYCRCAQLSWIEVYEFRDCMLKYCPLHTHDWITLTHAS